MPDLLHSAVIAANKGVGVNMHFVKEMLDYIWPSMMQAMSTEMDLDVLTTFLDATASLIDVVDSQLLDQEKVRFCLGYYSFIRLECKLRECCRNGLG